MLTSISIARPYARAVFSSALDGKNVEAWSDLLGLAEKVIEDKRMQDLLKNPFVNKVKLYECLLVLCEPALFSSGKNFLKLLSCNRRFLILPKIKELFDYYKTEQANQIVVQVSSAVPLFKEEKRTLVNALSRHLQRQIKVSYSLDKSILGGLIIRVGDLVMDGSVCNKLKRLRTALINKN